MVNLLNDEERLKNERARFLLTRKRFIQNGSGISSEGGGARSTSSRRAAHETGVIGEWQGNKSRVIKSFQSSFVLSLYVKTTNWRRHDHPALGRRKCSCRYR